MTPVLERVLTAEEIAPPEPLRWIYRAEPVMAAIALIAIAPLLVFVAVVIAALARRTPLVRHRRAGWRGSELPMLKFRTMWDARAAWGPLFTIEDVSGAIPKTKNGEDDRITSRFAAWCRRHSIDELPQLYHVARGEMSFVGPRPITFAELAEHYDSSAPAVLSLRPGLTGLWQMLGRSRLSYAKRKRLDLYMVRFASPALYVRILLRSVPRVLFGHDAY